MSYDNALPFQSPLDNLMLNNSQLLSIQAALKPLVEAKLKFKADPKDLVSSAVAMAYLDGQLYSMSAIVQAHENTLKKLSSTP